MEWNMKAATWDLGELDEATTGLASIEETIDGSSRRFGSDDRSSNKGEFSVDLKLGTQVGNSSSNEPAAVSKWKDVVGGVSKAMMASSSSLSSSSGLSKRARAINNGNQTVSCLVDGCNSDLSNCRDYHRRHKVCELHSKTPVVTINGNKQRFCQQCSRFHSLEEFDEGKRSCRKRLDGHNRRRRKPQGEGGGGGGGRSGSFLSNYQGTHLLPFSTSQVYPSTAMAHPPWNSSDVRLHHKPHHHHLHHLVDHLGLSSSSSSSYTEASNNNNIVNANKHQQLVFLQGDDSTTMENNNQQALPPPAASVCQTFLRATSLFPAAPPLHGGGGDHHDSHCALSLLSSPQTPHTSGSGLSQMVQPHQQGMSIMQQQNQSLGLSLHDHGLQTVDPAAVLVHHGSDHCPTMYNMNEAPPPFPFHWE